MQYLYNKSRKYLDINQPFLRLYDTATVNETFLVLQTEETFFNLRQKRRRFFHLFVLSATGVPSSEDRGREQLKLLVKIA